MVCNRMTEALGVEHTTGFKYVVRKPAPAWKPYRKACMIENAEDKYALDVGSVYSNNAFGQFPNSALMKALQHNLC